MSNKLNAELSKVKKRDLTEAEEINGVVEEANQLRLGSHQEYEEIKRNLNIHRNVNFETQASENVKRIQAHEKIYNQESFTGSQLKALCIKYDLRVLPISDYTGKIPVEFYRKIKEFKDNCTAQKVRVTDSNFFILAPVEMFETVKVTRIVDRDPIVFYLEESDGRVRENDVLTKVYSWGNDFSFMRMFRYFVNTWTYNNVGTSNRARTILFSILFALVGLLSFTPVHWLWTAILSSILGLLYIGGTFNETRENRIYDNLWNKKEY